MGHARTVWTLALLGLLAATGPWLLPAVDARLPGGSMPWQVGSACVAGLSAGCGWRAVAGLRSLSARTVRLVAVVSWVASATWGLALGLLWLLWPR